MTVGRPALLPVRLAVLVLTGVLLYHVGLGAVAASARGVALLDGPPLRQQAQQAQQQAQQQRELSERRRYEYLRDELGRAVPPGTAMAIVSSDVKWTQRLAEFAAIDRIDLVTEPGQAEVTATVVADRASPVGIRLVIERFR